MTREEVRQKTLNLAFSKYTFLYADNRGIREQNQPLADEYNPYFLKTLKLDHFNVVHSRVMDSTEVPQDSSQIKNEIKFSIVSDVKKS